MSRVFVTGATGNVGSQVVRYLLEAGNEVVAAKKTRSGSFEAEGLDWIDFDYRDPETWPSSIKNVSKVFLVRPPHISNIRRDMAPYLEYLREQEVKHILFMSVQGVEKNRMIPHYKIEQFCVSLKLPYTFIRPGFFMQNLTTTHLEEIRDEGLIFTPTGKGRTNFVDVRDIGEVAAKILTFEEPQNRIYTITGDRSYSYGEVADMLTSILEIPIRFTDPGPIRFIVGNLKRGRKLAMALVMLFLYSAVRFGKSNITTGDTMRILQRKPRSLRSFIEEHQTLLTGDDGVRL